MVLSKWIHCTCILGISMLIAWPPALSSRTSAQVDGIHAQDSSIIKQVRVYLHEGVKAYTDHKLEEAAHLFEKAIELDPEFEVARMYLAITYTSQFVPGSNDPQNEEAAYKAIETFKQVVARAQDPAKPNIDAMLSIAALYYQLTKYPDSKNWCGAILKIDPHRAEAYYRIGVMAFDNSLESTGVQGEKIESMSPDQRSKTLAGIEDGLMCLEKALEIRPDFFDAMEYQNLLWREKAKFEKDEATKAELIHQADLVSQKALSLRLRAREEK